MAEQIVANQTFAENEGGDPNRHTDSERDAGFASLLRGIARDAQDLLQQQLTLFQVEFKNDVRRTAVAIASLTAGGVICLVAAIILAIALAMFLGSMVPGVPLWGWFGIVGGALAVIGAALIIVGKTRFDAFNPLPDKSVQGLMENIQWKTKT